MQRNRWIAPIRSRAMRLLGVGAIVQVFSFVGIFLSMVVANHLLSEADFGGYVAVTASASLAGGFVCLGLDKMALRLATRAKGNVARLAHILATLCVFAAVGLILVCTIAAFGMAIGAGLAIPTSFLVFVTAWRMIVGGFLRGSGFLMFGLLGPFSLQPLALAGTFGFIWLIFGDYDVAVHFQINEWLLAAIIIEMI